MARRIGVALAGGLGAWLVLLVLFGWLGDGCVEDRVEARLERSMRAQVSIGALDVGPVTGVVELRQLVIEKSERGHFRLAIDHVEADVLPLGLALFQDTVGEVVARGIDVEVSALGALDLGGGHEPVRFERLELRDIHAVIEATSLLPSLAKIDLTIERAVCGPTTLRTPLSWLFALERLTARLALPGGITVRATFEQDKLTLSGGPFDSKVEIPFEIPELDPARELEQLEQIARRVLGALAAELGSEWLKDKLP